MRRTRRRHLAFWLPWLLMTFTVTATYIECYRAIHERSADRFTGSQGRELIKRVEMLERKFPNSNGVE